MRPAVLMARHVQAQAQVRADLRGGNLPACDWPGGTVGEMGRAAGARISRKLQREGEECKAHGEGGEGERRMEEGRRCTSVVYHSDIMMLMN